MLWVTVLTNYQRNKEKKVSIHKTYYKYDLILNFIQTFEVSFIVEGC